MKAFMYSSGLVLSLLSLVLLSTPSFAIGNQSQDLNPESIAEKSLSVAEAMKTSGYCYTGVSRALSPLGVSLTGEAAYQAKDQLLADSRFRLVSQDQTIALRRGDIVVYNKSASHPYGHIYVFQGNGQETSDHIAQVTSPSAYGGFTVFRLNSEMGSYDNDFAIGSSNELSAFMPPTAAPTFAPDFHGANSILPVSYGGNVPPVGDRLKRADTKYGGSPSSGDISTGEFVRKQVRILAKSQKAKH